MAYPNIKIRRNLSEATPKVALSPNFDPDVGAMRGKYGYRRIKGLHSIGPIIPPEEQYTSEVYAKIQEAHSILYSVYAKSKKVPKHRMQLETDLFSILSSIERLQHNLRQ